MILKLYLGYAKEHEPCIIFMDEIDAIGGRRFSEGTSADREIQRTLMEVKEKSFGTKWHELTLFYLLVAQSNGWL